MFKALKSRLYSRHIWTLYPATFKGTAFDFFPFVWCVQFWRPNKQKHKLNKCFWPYNILVMFCCQDLPKILQWLWKHLSTCVQNSCKTQIHIKQSAFYSNSLCLKPTTPWIQNRIKKSVVPSSSAVSVVLLMSCFIARCINAWIIQNSDRIFHNLLIDYTQKAPHNFSSHTLYRIPQYYTGRHVTTRPQK